MDNTEEFTTIEWCAGYAGIQLGLKRAIPNLRTVVYSEIEAFACANLVAKMEAGTLDTAPIWTDIKTFPCEEFRGKVDCLIAGYPCQPFSAAGKRQGADDPRHLWPFIRKAIGIIQPRYCFFENVEGHISLGLSTVISDLEEDGYTTTWGIFSAEECGAPRRRKRVFILANRNSINRSAQTSERDNDRQTGQTGEELAYRNSEGFQGLRECDRPQRWQEPNGHPGSSCQVWPARPGQPQYDWEPPRVVNTESTNRGRTSDGIHHTTEWEPGAAGFETTGQGIVGDTANIRQCGASTDTREATTNQEREECGVYEPERTGALSYNDTQQNSGGEERGLSKGNRQTEPSLGRNPDGSPDRLDYAELCQSCDNRTDELRLLGNGVVPATAEIAWRTLYARIKGEKS